MIMPSFLNLMVKVTDHRILKKTKRNYAPFLIFSIMVLTNIYKYLRSYKSKDKKVRVFPLLKENTDF